MSKSHLRSVKTTVIRKGDGQIVEYPPAPSRLAPLTSESVQPDLADIYDDIPLAPEPPQRDKPQIERTTEPPQDRNSPYGLPVISMKQWDISPADFFPEIRGR